MTEEQELNKKLAEWAGFKRKPTKSLDWDDRLYWDENLEFEAPDFTQSLDACFKWLVPKLIKMGGWVSCGIGDDEAFALVDADNDEFFELFDGKHFEGEAETPALALCEAIEKLIDAGK